jgi:hypothetical protein
VSCGFGFSSSGAKLISRDSHFLPIFLALFPHRAAAAFFANAFFLASGRFFRLLAPPLAPMAAMTCEIASGVGWSFMVFFAIAFQYIHSEARPSNFSFFAINLCTALCILGLYLNKPTTAGGPKRGKNDE